MTPATIEAQKQEAQPVNGLVKVAPSSGDAMVSMIERALMSPDFDVAKLQHLLELRERHEAVEARKAFVTAMNEFKAHPPVLEKVKKVDFSSKGGTRVHYNYAPLDHISKVLGEALSRHNLSFRWNVRQVERQVDVSCVLQHSGGHSESVTMTAGTHDDDRMNAIQRLGSTITYLERYTLLAATGMATQEQDDDARATPPVAALDAGKVLERCEWIANCRNMDELKKIYGDAYTVASKAKDRSAQQRLIDAYEARKKELL